MSEFLLSKNINRVIKNLAVIYKDPDPLASEVLSQASLFLQENINTGGFNGDQVGHGISFFVAEPLLLRIGSLNNLKKLETKIQSDLNQRLGTIQNEYIASVTVELFDEENEECQNSYNVYHNKIIKTDVSHIWKVGYLRLFISHKDTFKTEAATLKDYLESYGISCFVAHDNIEPMKEWQDEIENALFTMDALLIMLTNDFHDSYWTDQEIGVAIGRNVPVYPLRLEEKNPYGFISKFQAIKSNFQDLKGASQIIFDRVINSSVSKNSIKNALIEKFVNSKNYDDSIFFMVNLFPLLKDLNEEQINKIKIGFSKNDQLFTCIVVNKSLPRLLKEITNREFTINGRELVEAPKW